MSAKSAFKILTAQQWADFERERVFHGATIDVTDGYIHLSTAEQLEATLAKHFAGQTGLIIVEVDLALLESDVRWEPAREGALFPHLYGAMPIDAVVAITKRD